MWYAVEALFVCNGAEPTPDEVLYEASIFLVRAKGEDQVRRKAERVVRAVEAGYNEREEKEGEWRFVKILDIQAARGERLRDGLIIFSRVMRGLAPGLASIDE